MGTSIPIEMIIHVNNYTFVKIIPLVIEYLFPVTCRNGAGQPRRIPTYPATAGRAHAV